MASNKPKTFILDLKEIFSEEEALNVAEILFGCILDDENNLNK
jgi:hypothetical protein